MGIIRPFLAFLAFVCVTGPAYAYAQTDYLSVSVGYFDVLDSEKAADLRLEYRPGYNLLGVENLHSWAGVEVTSDLSAWGGAGLLYDWNVAGNFHVIPNVGAGLYAQGSSDKDLGHVIEFRSQLEAAYQFEDSSRVGVSFGHISNASLDDQNPGTEVINLYWHVPFGKYY